MAVPSLAQMSSETSGDSNETSDDAVEFRRSIGYILGFSYPLLAFATSGRVVYQLWVEGPAAAAADGDAPYLSLAAMLLYLVATVGFFVRKPWAWRLSVVSLAVETCFTLVIGSLSIAAPDLIGRNAWTGFGIDYAFFPLVQPLLGLIWLLWSDTRNAYGFGAGSGSDNDSIAGASLEEGPALGS